MITQFNFRCVGKKGRQVHQDNQSKHNMKSTTFYFHILKDELGVVNRKPQWTNIMIKDFEIRKTNILICSGCFLKDLKECMISISPYFSF